jgi:hypothetical protein
MALKSRPMMMTVLGKKRAVSTESTNLRCDEWWTRHAILKERQQDESNTQQIYHQSTQPHVWARMDSRPSTAMYAAICVLEKCTVFSK